MFLQVVTENGQKKLIPLTADAGAGNPVGTIIPMYKKSSPSGYLYCDGSTFDQTKYPLLYAYLGSNVLPDYREFALVGAEENTTDVYNASTNPTGTIHDHDVYTEGQAKDDQLQNFTIGVANEGGNANSFAYGSYSNFGTTDLHTLALAPTRDGDVTRGKRKAVYFYIKATSGISEEAQDTVASQLNAERSYSTSEINTGKTWIDGKPIYRKVIKPTSTKGTQVNFNLPANISTYTHYEGYVESGATWTIPINTYRSDVTVMSLLKSDKSEGIVFADGTLIASSVSLIWVIIIEYTKTTD